MKQADRGYAGIVYCSTLHARGRRNALETLEIVIALGENVTPESLCTLLIPASAVANGVGVLKMRALVTIARSSCAHGHGCANGSGDAT